MVPGLPPRAGEVPAAARPGIQHAVPAADGIRTGGSRQDEIHGPAHTWARSGQAVSVAERARHHQLRHLSPLSKAEATAAAGPARAAMQKACESIAVDTQTKDNG